MEISDFIPLIVIVGSIIYSIMSNINKKKEQSTETKGTKNVDVEFPEILDDKKYRDITIEEKIPVKKTIQPKKKNIPAETAPVFIEDDESEIFSFDFNDKEEVQKAIIYSEIFSRKS